MGGGMTKRRGERKGGRGSAAADVVAWRLDARMPPPRPFGKDRKGRDGIGRRAHGRETLEIEWGGLGRRGARSRARGRASTMVAYHRRSVSKIIINDLGTACRSSTRSG